MLNLILNLNLGYTLVTSLIILKFQSYGIDFPDLCLCGSFFFQSVIRRNKTANGVGVMFIRFVHSQTFKEVSIYAGFRLVQPTGR